MADHIQMTQLPEKIQAKLALLQNEVDQIISGAAAFLKTELPNPVAFQFKSSAPRDVLTPYERAQSISFITRFNHLPTDYAVKIIEQQGTYSISNMAFLRHALNEFRPLIQSESDSVYYQNIH